MQCLVMILEVFPEKGAVEIIYPVKETNLLAERTKSESIILSMVLVIFATLLSTISIVPRALSQVILSWSSLWQGIHTDLSSLVAKPALERSVLTASATILHHAFSGLRILFSSPSVVKINSHGNALMPPLFLKRLKNFWELVRGGR